MFWDGSFQVEETMIIHDSSLRWVEQRVKDSGAWPRWRYAMEGAARTVRDSLRGGGGVAPPHGDGA
jgi:hypothetical protein